MLWKKTSMCYKGKECEECCNHRMEDAVKNRTYFVVLIVGIVLMIMALVTKTSDNQVFVNQVSFASTITSIILSVIAIWMSITGERQNSEIKGKVVDASDRLSETVGKTQSIMQELETVLEKQNEFSEIMSEKLSKVDKSVEEMKGLFPNVVSSLKEKNADYIDAFMNGASKWRGQKALIECMLSGFENNQSDKLSDCIHKICRNNKLNQVDEGSVAGIMSVLYHNKFFCEEKNKEKVERYKTSN